MLQHQLNWKLNSIRKAVSDGPTHISRVDLGWCSGFSCFKYGPRVRATQTNQDEFLNVDVDTDGGDLLVLPYSVLR